MGFFIGAARVLQNTHAKCIRQKRSWRTHMPTILLSRRPRRRVVVLIAPGEQADFLPCFVANEDNVSGYAPDLIPMFVEIGPLHALECLLTPSSGAVNVFT